MRGRTLGTLALALALAAGPVSACGSGKGKRLGTATSIPGETTAAGAEGTDGGTAASTPGTGKAAGTTAKGTKPTTATGPGPTRAPGQQPPPTAPGATAPAGDPVRTAATGPVGNLAPALLRSKLAASDVLDLMVAAGAAPQAENVSHATARLQSAAGKPVITTTGTADAAVKDRTSGDLVALADAGERTPQGGGKAVLRILFLHGRFSQDGAARDDVLGVTVRGDTIAIFEDVIADSSSITVSPARIEESVLLHEVGHALGLVDLFLHTGRQDPEHPGHSTNPKSVMYFAVESDPLSALLGGPPPIEFDDADLADLATIRSS